MTDTLDEQRLTEAQLVAGANQPPDRGDRSGHSTTRRQRRTGPGSRRAPARDVGVPRVHGHRVLVGYVEEDELAGRRMLRVRKLQRADRTRGLGEPDPPLELEDRWRAYSPAALYSFTPLTETEARERYIGLFGDRERDDDIPF